MEIDSFGLPVSVPALTDEEEGALIEQARGWANELLAMGSVRDVRRFNARLYAPHHSQLACHMPLPAPLHALFMRRIVAFA